jgi:hypothetical protein
MLLPLKATLQQVDQRTPNRGSTLTPRADRVLTCRAEPRRRDLRDACLRR